MIGNLAYKALVGLATLLLAGALQAESPGRGQPVEVGSRVAPGPSVQGPVIATSTSTVPLKFPEISQFPLRSIGLPHPAAERAQPRAPSPGVPTEIGFARPLDAQGKALDVGRDLHWLPLRTGGSVATVSFASPSAAALRLGLRITRLLPDEVEVRVFRPGERDGQLVVGAELNAVIGRNLAAGENGVDAETYWSPVIAGEEIAIEVFVPPGFDPAGLGLRVEMLSHLRVSPDAPGALDFEVRIGEADVCHADVVCYPEWAFISRAVARMIFTRQGGTYLCSGTLLNDVPASNTPHFLTANHCISTQAVASSLQTYWFYRAAQCDSGTLAPEQVTRYGGAELLYAGPATDTTLLRLLEAPPSGAVYSGWSLSTPTLASSMSGVHHPRGDLQKISLGSVRSFRDCDPSDGGSTSFSCWAGTQQASNFIDIQYSVGTTEGGSSGSGVFRLSDQRLMGVLYGGSSSCAAPDGVNIYGRLDRSYLLGDLGRWLNPADATYALTVSRAGAGSGVVTSVPAIIDCGAVCSASFANGEAVQLYATANPGSEFLGWSGSCSGTGSCALVMDSAKNVTATFGLAVTPLQSGDTLTNLSGTPGSSRYFSITVPEGATNLRVTLAGGSGDADLFVNLGTLPAWGAYDCASQGLDSNENCALPAPAAGVYYLQVYGFSGYSGVTLTVSYDPPPACPYPRDVTLAATSVLTTVTLGACHTLGLEPGVRVEPTGDLTLEAGSRVGISPGFQVLPGGRLRIMIDTMLAE